MSGTGGKPTLDMANGLAEISLYGSADITPSSLNPDTMMISLTPLETDKIGTAFLIPGIKAVESYSLDVIFRIHKQEGQDGADGMAVVVLSVPLEDVEGYRNATGQVRVVGDGGAGLGYTGLGSQQDFAIELDTYRRYVEHVASCTITRIENSSPEASTDVMIRQYRISRCTSHQTRIINLQRLVRRRIPFQISRTGNFTGSGYNTRCILFPISKSSRRGFAKSLLTEARDKGIKIRRRSSCGRSRSLGQQQTQVGNVSLPSLHQLEVCHKR